MSILETVAAVWERIAWGSKLHNDSRSLDCYNHRAKCGCLTDRIAVFARSCCSFRDKSNRFHADSNQQSTLFTSLKTALCRPRRRSLEKNAHYWCDGSPYYGKTSAVSAVKTSEQMVRHKSRPRPTCRIEIFLTRFENWTWYRYNLGIKLHWNSL